MFPGDVWSNNVNAYVETESWNGSAWTEVKDLNDAEEQADKLLESYVNRASALLVGDLHQDIEEILRNLGMDSSWTEVNDLNTATLKSVVAFASWI